MPVTCVEGETDGDDAQDVDGEDDDSNGDADDHVDGHEIMTVARAET